jgi:triacylglycerol esterase/lipase EstA (alpha/beta hydrolase family)
MTEPKLVVLVHGWSVRSTETYGQLPDRLESEAKTHGLDIDIQQIWLGRYVSFRDEVRIEDISRAFEAAIRKELGPKLGKGRRFVAITHSTGGPVVRDWWNRLYAETGQLAECPLSHLIMLAPANFGSALAQLGKGVVGRLSSWFQGVEPGQGVLDWLELGSPESLALNQKWIASKPPWNGAKPMFPFVLTGQTQAVK